jgi:hypothetical protein
VRSINDPTNGQPFPNAYIPPSRFDPAAVALTKYIPTGTGAGLVYYGGRVIQSFDEVPVRIDHTLTDKDRLTLRYYFARFNNSPFLDTKNYVNNNNYAIIDAHNFMLNETHTFTPGLLNDFRFSVARETSDRGPAAGSINAADLGVKLYQPSEAKTIQGINVQNYFNVAQQNPARFVRTQYTLSDGVYWTRGSHSLTFGVDVNRTWVLIRNQFNQPGAWTFSADTTNLAMASFFLGYVRNFLQGNGEFKDNRVNTFGLYLQDDWRVSRKLTLNLGLRYDPFFPWKETKGRVELFKPDAYAQGVTSKMFVNAPRGLLFPGDPGIAKYGLNAAYKNFAPRLGFAYDVRGDGTWSIRGGVGIFYDAMQNGIYNNRFVDVSPFSVQVNQTPALGTFSDPYRGQVNPFPAPYPPPKDIVFPSPVQVATYDPANGSVYQTPVSYAWNLTVEHQLRRDYPARCLRRFPCQPPFGDA